MNEFSVTCYFTVTLTDCIHPSVYLAAITSHAQCDTPTHFRLSLKYIHTRFKQFGILTAPFTKSPTEPFLCKSQKTDLVDFTNSLKNFLFCAFGPDSYKISLLLLLQYLIFVSLLCYFLIMLLKIIYFVIVLI